MWTIKFHSGSSLSRQIVGSMEALYNALFTTSSAAIASGCCSFASKMHLCTKSAKSLISVGYDEWPMGYCRASIDLRPKSNNFWTPNACCSNNTLSSYVPWPQNNGILWTFDTTSLLSFVFITFSGIVNHADNPTHPPNANGPCTFALAPLV